MAIQTIQVRRRFPLRLAIGLIVATLVLVALLAWTRPVSTGPAPIPYTTTTIHMPPHHLGVVKEGSRPHSSFPDFRARGSGQLQPSLREIHARKGR